MNSKCELLTDAMIMEMKVLDESCATCLFEMEFIKPSGGNYKTQMQPTLLDYEEDKIPCMYCVYRIKDEF